MNVHSAIVEAYRLWGAGRADEVDALCRATLAQAPEHPGAHHLLGLVARAGGQFDRAIDHMGRASAAGNCPAFILDDLADLLTRRGRFAEAEGAARRALALDGNRVAAWHRLALVLLAAGKEKKSR